MFDRYEPAAFEAKWRKRWSEADLYATKITEGAPKFYGLDFFPYPSGAGLSVGHCRNYIPTDVLCRMKRMQGHNVLHPMGFDAFGLPAENEAIKNKTHPAPMIERYAARYREQMDLVAISYDWSRSFKSCEPSYYRWTQWLFELLYKRGLAYQKLAAVNWDPVDKTVLADEEVIAGRAERSGALVERRYIAQWFFKITEYAQRLIDDLDTVDWPEGIKQQQRNWIGRSEGVQFTMKVKRPSAADQTRDDYLKGSITLEDAYDKSNDADFEVLNSRSLSFDVFTTRIDTVFGMTFCVLAPEHAVINEILKFVPEDRKAEVEAYREAASRESDTERLAAKREKTGVFTGAYAINPANGQSVPIWIADYVLATYGTGAIMAVPAHDERDFEFAQKFGIPVVQVVAPKSGEPVELPFVTKDGVLVNSGEYNGFGIAEAMPALGEWIEALGIGERKIQYKLRDWLISRQRYWGCPIPIIHSAEGEIQAVPEDCLPVLLPDVEHYEPGSDGSSPLKAIDEFYNTTDLDGRLGHRETDTMGGFACSSWYFLRFCDPHNDEMAYDKELADYWMPVDCYVGGAEHAVMHLLYARFFTKVLYDAGLVSVQEPFRRLRNQGQVLAHTPYRKPRADEKLGVEDDGILISFAEAATLPDDEKFFRWARMSKSKGNVVTPEEAVESYGADALRLYELFVAPFDADVQWTNEAMQGTSRFLSRIFKWVSGSASHYDPLWWTSIGSEELSPAAKDLRKLVHKTIRKATEDIERFAFNTYVSSLMEFLNHATDLNKQLDPSNRGDALAISEAIESFLLMLAPSAPHSADELWAALGREGFTLDATWPAFNAALAADDVVTIAVQVNGKLRDTLQAPAASSQEELLELAKASAKVTAHLDGKTIRKEIVVPGKLVNIVVG